MVITPLYVAKHRVAADLKSACENGSDSFVLLESIQCHCVFKHKSRTKYAYERVRTTPNLPSGESQLMFVRMMSEITQTNLVHFFRRWGFLTENEPAQHRITQSQIDAIVAYIEAQNFPLPYMIEYIDDSNWTIFRDRLPVQPGTAQQTVTGTTPVTVLTMTNWRNVVAFEVFEGDRLVFVSNRSRFTLSALATANTRVYAVSFDGQRIPVTF